MICVSCPLCQSVITLSDEPHIGQRLVCQTCGAELEVTWLYPISVDITESGVSAYSPLEIENK